MAIDISDYMQIPYTIAKKFTKSGEQVKDSEVYADACVGLFLASNRYDPTLGVPFGAYARTKIMRHLCDVSRSQFGRGRKRYIPFVQSDVIHTILVLDDLDRPYEYEWIVYAAKQHLTEREQSIFLRRLNGDTSRQISVEMNLSMKHIHYVVRRCTDILRAVYQGTHSTTSKRNENGFGKSRSQN